MAKKKLNNHSFIRLSSNVAQMKWKTKGERLIQSYNMIGIYIYMLIIIILLWKWKMK